MTCSTNPCQACSVMTSSWVNFPLVHLDVRVWLAQLSRERGRTITLSEVPDAEIDKWSPSLFQRELAHGCGAPRDQSRTLALNNPSHPDEWADILPDWKPDDAVASPYSITVTALQKPWAVPLRLELRKRLARRGIKLILDFVANHTLPSIRGLARIAIFISWSPIGNSTRWIKAPCFKAEDGAHLACGRDANFPPWRETGT